jgi:chemotaxis signal transduction protein
MSSVRSQTTVASGAAVEIDELLRRRADRLRMGDNAGESEALMPVAEFALGEEAYAIPLRDFRAVAPLRLVTPVPLAEGALIGVLRFQGRIIKALSLASLLGTSGWRVDPRVLLVVAGPGGELVALDCEQIPKPGAVPLAALDAARAVTDGPIFEVTMRDKRHLHVIDVERLLGSKRDNP